MAEAAGDDEEVEIRGEGGLLVPDLGGGAAGGGVQGDSHVSFAVGAGEDDDGGVHGRGRLLAGDAF